MKKLKKKLKKIKKKIQHTFANGRGKKK